MNTIRFNNVVPQVFSASGQLDSGVWQHDILFEKGKVYLVEADSGKGKSTFCSYVQGYRHDFSGQILFDDTDILRLRSSQWVAIRQRNISLLFQELRLFPELTAMENVEIKNKLTGHKSRRQIEQWFTMLGISDKQDTRVGLMSFGQQQRVAMMRALVQPFDFILADEPISHLDDANAALMADIMMTEARSQGAGVIVTSIGKHMQLDYDQVIKL